MLHLCFWTAASLLEELSPTGPQLQSHSFGLLSAHGSGPLKHFCFASWYNVKFCHWRHTSQECFASCFWLLHCRSLPSTLLQQVVTSSTLEAPPGKFCGRGSVPSRRWPHKQLFAASQRRDFQPVPPVRRHDDLSAIQGARAVPSPMRPEPPPLLDVPLSPRSRGFCLELLFLHSLEFFLLLTHRSHYPNPCYS